MDGMWLLLALVVVWILASGLIPGMG